MRNIIIHAIRQHIEQTHPHLTYQLRESSLTITHEEHYIARIEPEGDQISILHSICNIQHTASTHISSNNTSLMYHDKTKINLADPQLLDKIKAIIT